MTKSKISKKHVNRNVAAIVFSVIVFIFVVIAFVMMQRNTVDSSIDSYQKCADAGYPIQESFPTRCVTPDGKSFVGPTE